MGSLTCGGPILYSLNNAHIFIVHPPDMNVTFIFYFCYYAVNKVDSQPDYSQASLRPPCINLFRPLNLYTIMSKMENGHFPQDVEQPFE